MHQFLAYSMLLNFGLCSVFCQSKSPYIKKSGKYWREILSPEAYKVLREKGTEEPYTGKYLYNKKKGIYVCCACGAELYLSKHKYDSGCGWPSFDRGNDDNIGYRRDTSHGMIRTEIYCKRCGGHLGHIFGDGPKNTTGKRHCVNSVSMEFIPDTK